MKGKRLIEEQIIATLKKSRQPYHLLRVPPVAAGEPKVPYAAVGLPKLPALRPLLLLQDLVHLRGRLVEEGFGLSLAIKDVRDRSTKDRR